VRPPKTGYVIVRASGVGRSGRDVTWEVVSDRAGRRYWLVQLDKDTRKSTVLRETTDLKKAHRWGIAIVRLDRHYRRVTASQIGAVIAKLDEKDGRDPRRSHHPRRGSSRRGARSRRDPPGTRCPVGTRVQTLLLSRVHFPSASRAREWATDHGFVSSKVDPGANYFRLRQADPKAFRSGSLRTIRLRPGVMAVVGCPR
jgi:hypothetical protein